VPAELTEDPVLYGECLSGAMYWRDFLELAGECGFTDPRLVTDSPIDVTDPELQNRLGDLCFRSVTYRLFRIDQRESGPENYGQFAVYNGGLPEQDAVFRLDTGLMFKKGEKTPICGNTARILSSSRFSGYFEIIGDDSVHLGAFEESGIGPVFTKDAGKAPAGGCC
jgi:arsenite methyltransferase